MPSRPRQSVKDTFARGVARRPAATETATETDPVTEVATARAAAATPTSAPTKPRPRKFTVLLDIPDADAFTRLTARIQEQLPDRLVRKSDVIRAFVALAGDDATLRDQVTQQLRAETDPA